MAQINTSENPENPTATLSSEKPPISSKTKIIMAVCILFMPVFLILPFFFWGNEDSHIPFNVKEAQSSLLAPVGKLTVGEAPAAAPAEEVAFDPQQTYDKVCAACHANGTLGAPKFGENADWAKRLAAHGSVDALVASGIKGIGAMPPKGGATISDAQFHEMIIFMLDHAKVEH